MPPVNGPSRSRAVPLLLMAVSLLAAVPVLGGDLQTGPSSLPQGALVSDQDWVTSPKPAEGSGYQATLTPTFHTRPSPPASVRDLSHDLHPLRTEGMLASTTWLNGAFSTETEVATNHGETDDPAGRMHGGGANDPSTRMMRLGLTASSGSLRYGVRYRNAGQAFYHGSDQALKEFWSEWSQGITTLSSAFGQQWNNVAADPTRPRVDQNYGRVGLSWNKPTWPTLAVTFSQKELASMPNVAAIMPRSVNDQTIEAALGYAGSVWNARLASSYTLQSDLLSHGSDSRVKSQTLTASFRPFTTLTIAPTVGYRAEQQEWTGVRIDAPSVSLAMNYRQSRRLLISAMGNYTGLRSSDRLIDLETIGGTGTLAWDLRQSSDWSTLLSVEAGFNRQINHVTPAERAEDLSGILRLILARL